MPRSTAALNRRIMAARVALHGLDRALAALASALRAYKPAEPRSVVRKRYPLSTKARAALKLQGAYMGHMRQLKPAQKAMVRAIKEKSGVKAAIRKARELAGKRAA